MYKETFGKRLTVLMAERGWTDRRVGEVVGVTGPMVVRYRQGRNFPECSLMIRMADTFNVSLDWLTGRSRVRVVQVEGVKQKKIA